MNEEWRDVVGYEGYYQVSSNGKVKSLSRKLGNNHVTKDIVMKPVIDKYGYKRLGLYKNNKLTNALVHRLVATAFVDNNENKNIVNHKDENKTNNNIDNLEWVTVKENNNYGTRIERISNSNKNKIKVIYRDNTYEIWDSAIDFAKEFGILQSNIIHCLKGRQKTYHGLRFEYA